MKRDLIEKLKRMKELPGDEKLALLKELQETQVEELFTGSIKEFMETCEQIAKDNDIDISTLSTGAAAAEEEDTGMPSMYKIVITKFKPKNPKNPAEDLSAAAEFIAASEAEKTKMLSTSQVQIVIKLKNLIGDVAGWGLLDVKKKIGDVVNGTPLDFPGEFQKNDPQGAEKVAALKAAGLECEMKKV
jgi:hypothetical protein